MGPISYMRSVVDRKVGMPRTTAIGDMVLANSGFHTGNSLSENNPHLFVPPCTDPSMRLNIQESDVQVTCRVNFWYYYYPFSIFAL